MSTSTKTDEYQEREKKTQKATVREKYIRRQREGR